MRRDEACRFLGSLDNTKSLSVKPGDICVMYDASYICTGVINEKPQWTFMCDRSYDKGEHIIPKICQRCGAPLTGHECEYCGTRY